MFAIISILLIASASALNLPAASISAVVSKDFRYQIENKSVRETMEDFTKLISNIQLSLGFQDKKNVEQLVEGISSHLNSHPYVPNAKYLTPYKFPQILKINTKLGVLRLIQFTVTVQVSTRTMTINGKYVDITQNIPPRSLDAAEIAQVNKALMDMVLKAQAKLN